MIKDKKYYIDYVCDQLDRLDSYYALMRSADDAILFANTDLDRVFAECFTPEGAKYSSSVNNGIYTHTIQTFIGDLNAEIVTGARIN